ncbi:MAG: hypothetical protein ACI92I_000225 [Acidimicrobiales bacterium]|jgi:hypothetical protein
MTIALICFASSAMILVVISAIFRIEDARGSHLLVLAHTRSLFNKSIVKLSGALSKMDTYVGRGFLRLMLHYLAHSVLQKFLSLINRAEKWVENLLRRNKQVSKDIRSAKKRTHLDAMTEHKEEVALTDVQKEKMRSHEA